MAEDVTIKTLSAVFQKQVTGLRKSVLDLSKKFGVVRDSVKTTAPKVIKLFDQLKAEYGLSFVEFARLFDASVPTNAGTPEKPGYRAHKVYYTLDYMRRLSNLRPRGQRGVRDSATDALARTIATVLQVVPNPEPIWQAVQKEFNFGERVMTGLRKRVENTKPLIEIKAKQAPSIGDVIHMESTKQAQGDAREAGPVGAVLARGGQKLQARRSAAA